ncbi:NAD(P)H azoreductase [Poriferisphaera corsica]|uniref:NAD(P)H azoreductase n=1 Tax=Poriferisphaera corsica TaxID=2528020 RepID=A0A517YWE5_9BACT|nr:NAD(P)H-binding protein [Poriferisphaera corsica]QDU34556.1 NAD(P)H azoreductase [Poriferisphaera corsica]
MQARTGKKMRVLVVPGNGKTGRRVAMKLMGKDVEVRRGSRSGDVVFDWGDRTSWAGALERVDAVYMAYVPDLSVPGARETVGAFADLAIGMGVKKLVLLSGRGEAKALAAEEAVLGKEGVDVTVVRPAWFNQNFDEGEFYELVMGGLIVLPAGDVKEPFIDVEDIADVVVAVLMGDGHGGEVYELTGPRLMDFDEVAVEISSRSGRRVVYEAIEMDAFVAGLLGQGMPEDYVGMLRYLFGELMDGRNAYVTDDVKRVLGRDAKDFRAYVDEAVKNGVWEVNVKA